MKDFSFSTECTSVSSYGSASLQESLDDVQAKQSALLFLCRINADSKEVNKFLLRYPEALLFEGMDSREGARSLIEIQMRQCKCFVSVCNGNRKKVLLLLKRGFEYYRGVALTQSLEEYWFFRNVSGGMHWDFHSKQLVALEKDIRMVDAREKGLKTRLNFARNEVQDYQRELESVARKEAAGRTPFALLKCQKNLNMVEKRSQMENKLGGIKMSMISMEKESALLGQERIAAMKLRQVLLTKAFAGCERHVCDATQRDLE